MASVYINNLEKTIKGGDFVRYETANHKTGLVSGLLIAATIVIIGYGAWCYGKTLLAKGESGEGRDFSLGETPTVEISLEEFNNIDHGDTLAEVMEGIRAEDFEVTAVFTADGEKLFEHTDYRTFKVETDVPRLRMMRQYKNLIFLHNHPVQEKASFSSLDLDMLADFQAGAGIVVSKNDTYVIIPNRKWPTKEEIAQFVRDRPDMMGTIWPQSPSGELWAQTVTTRELMELVAEEYDLSYYEWSKTRVSSEEVAAAILGD